MVYITPIQIRMARAALGWELRQLASRVGVTYQTVSRIENGLSQNRKIIADIQQAFEENGLRFINSEDGHTGVVVDPFSIKFHEGATGHVEIDID